MLRRCSCQERSFFNSFLGLGWDVLGDAFVVAVVVPGLLERLGVAGAAPLGTAAAGSVAGVVVGLVADPGLAEHVDPHRGARLGNLPGLLHARRDDTADLAAALADLGGLPPVGGLGLGAVLRGGAP